MVLLGFAGIEDVLPFLFVPVVFIIVFVVVGVALVKRAQAEKRKREMDEYKTQPLFTIDGNGRTDYQREYLAEKRRQLAEQKIKAADNAHSHAGATAEKYDKIVGSLGDVNDEGCEDLDGVRLIDHDEAYCDDPDHIISTDTTELERAIVLGEVLNTPRYKQRYGKR